MADELDLDAIEERWRRAGADRGYDEPTGCRCADAPHENALHDLADQDVPALVAEVKRLRKFIEEVADGGLNADLTPTMPGGAETYANFARYLRRLDDGLRDRARHVLGEAAADG